LPNNKPICYTKIVRKIKTKKVFKVNKKEQVTINNCTYKTYLIGAMENPNKLDGGVGWRQKLTPYLIERSVYVFDPTRCEMEKVGMPTEEFMQKLNGWQRSGNWQHFLENMRKIWKGVTHLTQNENGEPQVVHYLGDKDYVENSNFLIFNYDEGDKLGGTIAELTIAWYLNIPVYLVTNVPKTKINKSVLYFILDSGHGSGAIFKTQNELIEFLDHEYDFKKV
jgi:hypothetical protein